MSNTEKSPDEEFEAKLFIPPYRVDSFFPNRSTPGNVGLCLSGGGSRALVAGMGQLRALAYLESNGASLLSQIKATSTVSGGSWVGATYHFLTSATSDGAYLNEYVPDQGRLVLSSSEGSTLPETLDELPEGNIGNTPAHPLFAPEALAVEAVLLHMIGTPTHMIWQTLVGYHVLDPYGLYPHEDHLPDSLFSLDEQVLAAEVTGPNPTLREEQAALYPVGRPRSFLVCNFSMFVTLPGESGAFEFLVPVQSSPFYTSVVGTPDALDSNGQHPGGGGPSAFAFNSTLVASGEMVTVSQARQWSLCDLIGTSSAFFAQVLLDLLKSYEVDNSGFYETLAKYADELLAWFQARHSKLPKLIIETLEWEINRAADRAEHGKHRKHGRIADALASLIGDLQNLVPAYGYWSALADAPVREPKISRFADGGDLENTGVCGMLAYTDIDNIISCVNSATAMVQTPIGVIDAEGKEIPNTRVMVSGQLPALFGYQPYREGVGYKLYAGDDDPSHVVYRNNQVFPSSSFAAVLQGLWAASTNDAGDAGVRPAVFSSRLSVLDNEWFGVRGGREITVVWVYNNFVSQWQKLLSSEVSAEVSKLVDTVNFPHYSTIRTHLSAQEINLMSNLNAWVIANDDQASLVRALFK